MADKSIGNMRLSKILPEISLKTASAILLSEQPLTGSPTDKLRAAYDADKSMSKALGWFLNDDFEIIDKNQDGFLHQHEINLGRALRPKGVRPEVLRFLNYKNDSIQKLSNDEWGVEVKGSTKKDIALYISGVDERFNTNLSKAFVSAIQKEDQRALESVVFQFTDRTEHIPKILDQAHEFLPVLHEFLPRGGAPGALRFSVTPSPGGLATSITINNMNYYRMMISTHPLVPSIAERNQNQIWGENWAPTTMKKAFSNIGGQARSNFWRGPQ